ncbi:MAG: hypothetical protein AAGD35_21390 [Actinomycetota bacterium]
MLDRRSDTDDDTTRRTAVSGEDGFTVASAMWVMAVTLVLVTAFANLFVQRYAQAVIRQATDEGARAWAVNGGSADECLLAANDVIGDLLGGSMASGIAISCVDAGDTIQVTASATLAGLPPLPDANFSTTSVVTKELEDGLELP